MKYSCRDLYATNVMVVLLLVLGIGLGSLLSIAAGRNTQVSTKRSVPMWTLGITAIVWVIGIGLSGTVLGRGNLNFYFLSYVCLIATPLLIAGNKLFNKHHWRWVLVVVSPIVALYLSRCWVDLQTYRYKDLALTALQPQVTQWNQKAPLSHALPPHLDDSELIVYHWSHHTQRIGITHSDTGEIEFLIELSPRQTYPTLKKVTRVDYLTSGDLMVWPSQ